MSLSSDSISICNHSTPHFVTLLIIKSIIDYNFHYRAHNVNTLIDLRGCTYACCDPESLSGSKIVLKTLQEKGENASFFGSLLSMYY